MFDPLAGAGEARARISLQPLPGAAMILAAAPGSYPAVETRQPHRENMYNFTADQGSREMGI